MGLKEDYMKLWKEIFHDSDDYVDLIFGQYFDSELSAARYEDGRLVAALMGVPYEFKSSDGPTLKGIYLCGLATVPDKRREGLMSSLIEEINGKAAAQGFDFSFLVPAGEGVREYYRNRGYHDTFYNLHEHYVKGHKFGGESSLEVRSFDLEEKGELVKFLSSMETDLVKCEGEKDSEERFYALAHSKSDWETVLREALISGEPVYVARSEGRIRGVAFTRLSRQPSEFVDEKEIEVKRILAGDEAVEAAILFGIQALNPGANLTVIRSLFDALKNRGSQLWSPFYGQSNPPQTTYEDISEVEQPYNLSLGAKPFGMVRILSLPALLAKLGLPSESSFSNREADILLRRPEPHDADSLERLLHLPLLSLSASLLLE